MRADRFLLILLALAMAVPAAAQTIQPMTSGIVPVVIHSPGAKDSQWTTTVYATQLSGSVPGRLSWTLHNPAGDDWTTTVDLPGAGGTLEITDLVGTTSSSVPDGKYIMTWWSTHPVALSTRTFTNESTGSYGQGIASVVPGSGFGTDGEVVFPMPLDASDYRANVGIANAGTHSQTFEAIVQSTPGDTVRMTTHTVAPGAIEQFKTNDGLTGVGSVTVRCTEGCDGTAFAYASVVMNDSNDAYFLYAAASEKQSEVAPVASVRDARGVWFITGGSLYDVFEAMGYAIATDRLWQIETFRRSANGTLAALLGPSYVSDDVLARTVGYSPAELKAGFDNLDTESKTVIQAYVDGINRRIAEVKADRSQLPFEFKAAGAQLGIDFVPADWTTGDILQWVSALLRQFDPEAFDTGQIDNAAMVQALQGAYSAEALAMFQDLRWTNDPAAQTMIPAGESAAGAHAATPPPGAQLGRLPDMREAARHLDNRFSGRVARLEKINARTKMGSYAWVVSGDKTASGNPILYSGPQMGFMTPSIVTEGSINGGGLQISGMTVPGVPGIIIGRTPHHVWSMQVGHAHTTDYYLEAPQSVSLNRMETIKVAGAADVTIPVFRSPHGPVIEPLPYDPTSPPAVILSWKYAHWGYEFDSVKFALGMARAQSVAQLGAAIELAAVSQHFCYADRDGNIAYWMSGRDPVRPAGVDVRLPLIGDGTEEWDAKVLKRRAHAENPSQHYFGGWNNKSAVWYDNAPNNTSYVMGPAHRAHVIKEYLDSHDGLTFEQVRDLALNIATTDSIGGGGNPWEFVESAFTAAVGADSNASRQAALDLLSSWDGHFVAGGQSEWVSGLFRADAWVLQDAWIREVLRLVFEDEFTTAGLDFSKQPKALLFNVLLHALAGSQASLPTLNNWFVDRSGSGKPTDPDALIVMALDNALASLGPQPWNHTRGYIRYVHDLLGEVGTTPFASRSTYAHVVEMGSNGPLRIESMFPLGESGFIAMDQYGAPQFDPLFFGMKDIFDAFAPRDFPLFQ